MARHEGKSIECIVRLAVKISEDVFIFAAIVVGAVILLYVISNSVAQGVQTATGNAIDGAEDDVISAFDDGSIGAGLSAAWQGLETAIF